MSKITVIQNDEVWFQYEVYRGNYFLHLEVYKWSPSIYKACLTTLAVFLRTLYEQGITYVFTAIPEGDKKVYKFQEMMGFTEWNRKDGTIVFCQRTGE